MSIVGSLGTDKTAEEYQSLAGTSLSQDNENYQSNSQIKYKNGDAELCFIEIQYCPSDEEEIRQTVKKQ